MKSKEAEVLTGIPIKNIHYYEKEGLLQPGRSSNGYRDYTEEDIKRLKQVKLLRMMGISLEGIRNCLKEDSTLKEELENRIGDIEAEENYLRGTKALCEIFLMENIKIEDLPDTDQELLQENLYVYDRVLEEIKRKDRVRKKMLKARDIIVGALLLIAGFALVAYGLQMALEASTAPIVIVSGLFVCMSMIAHIVFFKTKI